MRVEGREPRGTLTWCKYTGFSSALYWLPVATAEPLCTALLLASQLAVAKGLPGSWAPEGVCSHSETQQISVSQPQPFSADYTTSPAGHAFFFAVGPPFTKQVQCILGDSPTAVQPGCRG